MAVYDLEEQDQLEDLKAWWVRWRNVVSGIVLVVCVGVVAVQGWRWWQHSQAEQASVLYGAIANAARANDLPKAKDAMKELTDKYAGTGYAPRGGLIVARMLFDNGDAAGAAAQLQWVIEKADADNLREIARYRLAEVQFDDKKYDEALRTLDAKHDAPFAGLYADLRGDILTAAGKAADARAAYQVAVAKLDPKSAYHAYVQVKLDGLGGPLTQAGGTVTGAAPATAAPAATTAAPAGAKAAAAPAKATPLAVTPAPAASAPTPLTVAPAK